MTLMGTFGQVSLMDFLRISMIPKEQHPLINRLDEHRLKDETTINFFLHVWTKFQQREITCVAGPIICIVNIKPRWWDRPCVTLSTSEGVSWLEGSNMGYNHKGTPQVPITWFLSSKRMGLFTKVPSLVNSERWGAGRNVREGTSSSNCH